MHAINEVLEGLKTLGLLRDTGRRRWSDRTRSYQIVWEFTELGDRWRESNGIASGPQFARFVTRRLTEQ